MTITDAQRAQAHALAQQGYGREDLRQRVGIPDSIAKAIVFGRQTHQTPIDVHLVKARTRPRPLRSRQASALSNRKAPITLPGVSILRDET